jgi:hypothetical protein
VKTKLEILVLLLLVCSQIGIPAGRHAVRVPVSDEKWHVNAFLAMQFDGPMYRAFVAGGAPCMFYYDWDPAMTPQPVCPYDPSNTNPFIPYVPQP